MKEVSTEKLYNELIKHHDRPKRWNFCNSEIPYFIKAYPINFYRLEKVLKVLLLKGSKTISFYPNKKHMVLRHETGKFKFKKFIGLKHL